MAQIQLTEDEILIAKDLIAHTTQAQQLRRAQAILWLSQGISIQQIAQRLCLSRMTIYNWVERFVCRKDLDFANRLLDADRSGRPRTALGIIDPIIAAVIDTDPRESGYHQTVWTADLLALYLKRRHHIEVSVPSVRLAIARLGIEWKRPRYDLGLKAKHWRQAKGGSNVGLGTESVRSS